MTVLPAAVLFDLDGTLIDGESQWEAAHRRVAAELGGELTAATLTELVGADVEASVSLLLAVTGHPITVQALDDTRGRLLAAVSALYAAGVDWMPGARRALRTVRRARLPIALVTNTPRAIVEQLLPTLGRELFDVVVCADDCPAGKPDPAPYLRAGELLGVPLGECVAVEDSPDGAVSAERAGAAVLVVPERVPVPPGPRRLYLPTLTEFSLTDLATARALAVAEPTFVDVMGGFGLSSIPRRRKP